MLQQQGSDQVVDVIDAGDLGKMRKSNDVRRRPIFFHLFQERKSVGSNAVALLVSESREEPKPSMSQLKIIGGFRDAALADNERLLALRQSHADDRPFFESVF